MKIDLKIKKIKNFAYELARKSPNTRVPGLLGRPRKAQEGPGSPRKS